MNWNPKIMAALAPTGIPAYPLRYSGNDLSKPPQYFIFFSYYDQLGAFASGEPIREDISGQVSLFSKTDYKELAEQAVGLLRAAGFKVQLAQELYEQDTGYYHQVIDVQWYENLYHD